MGTFGETSEEYHGNLRETNQELVRTLCSKHDHSNSPGYKNPKTYAVGEQIGELCARCSKGSEGTGEPKGTLEEPGGDPGGPWMNRKNRGNLGGARGNGETWEEPGEP